MNTKVLKVLAANARATVEDIAVMTGMTEDDVKTEISELEAAGIIRGYKTVIDWEKLDGAWVSALSFSKQPHRRHYGEARPL